MTETKRALSLIFLFVASTLPTPSTSSGESFIFGGCSQIKYTPGSTYESNINSLLTSLVNSAMFTSYNNFTFPSSSSSSGQDTVSGLFQCRGDVSNSDCAKCVARAVSQVGTICLDACGGALQLETCFIKYDNTNFLGVEDKTVVMKKCGPSISYNSDTLTKRDAMLAYLTATDGGYRIGGVGNLQGVAQCVGDLSPSECQDCLSEAIGRLKTECGPSAWGDMFLAKCYVRFTQGGDRSHGGAGLDNRNSDVEIEKTLAMIIGLITGVAFIVVLVSIISHYYEKRKGGK